MVEKKPAPEWDARRVCLLSLSASWQGTASADVWTELIAALGLEDDDAHGEVKDRFPAAGKLLVDGAEKGARRLALAVHDGSHGGDEGDAAEAAGSKIVAHWRLEIWRGRKEADAKLLEASTRVGGSTRLLEILGDRWPERNHPISFGVSARYRVDPATHELRQRFANPVVAFESAGLNFSQEATVWRVEGGDSKGYLTVGSAVVSEPFDVSWSGRLDVVLSSDIVNSLDRAAWDTIATMILLSKSPS